MTTSIPKNYFNKEKQPSGATLPIKSKKNHQRKNEKQLSVLLATNHLFTYTGSEITLITIAKKLKEKGHNVSVYAKYIDSHFIHVFDEIAPVLNDIRELSRYQFNAAYIQHNTIALEIRYQYPSLPILFASLGVLPFLEQPPLVDLDIYKHLAISEEVNDNLIHKGIDVSSIEIFRNIVDSNKFKPIRTINPKPLTAIVYSYKISPENLNVVQKACEALNIQCRRIGEGPGVIDQNNVAGELNKADIVFTLGRGVIETMMCGKIPIVYDYQGGDGMVTPANIHELMSHNFSGRRYGRQYQITEMIDEIKGYNPENATKLRELSVDLFDADKGVDQLISWLKNSTTKPIISATTERREKIRSLVELINITKEYSIEALNRALIARNNAVLKTGAGSRHEVRPPAAINTRSGVSPRVSIIIPLFNKVEYTKQCLETLIENTPDELYEVIIVDNASTDGTKDFLVTLEGDVTIIRNETNLGFAHACNQGADAAKGTFLLFLNNDTEPQKGWLEPLLKILDNDPTVAAAGSKLLFPDGKIQHAGVAIIEDKKLPDPLVARHIYYQKPSNLPEANQPRTYQALTAACILIRKDSYEKAGGFDEGYWNGYEDVDLCFKLQENGWKLVYQPESIVIHHESISGPERFNKVDHNINRLHERWIGKIKPDVIINKDGSTTATDAHQIQPYILPPEFKPEIKPGRSEIRNDLASIIILTFNQLEYTKKCLQSIAQYTSVPYELIIVDNGSTDGTAQFLENYANEHVNCKVILNKENLGFAGGNNQGIAAARGDYILLLNNDVIVTRDWLERLIAHIESDENIGMVGPVSNFVSGHQLVENTGYRKNLNKMHEFAKNHFQNNVGITQDIMRLVGFCLLIKRHVLDIIGGLDENYGNGNYEDDDLCLRSRIAGFRNIIARDVFIHHYGSMTFKGNKIDYTDSLEGNRRRFSDKWKDIIEVNGNEYRLRMTREDQLKKLLELGQERFSQGNFSAAVKIFERVLELDKYNSQAMNNLGVIQWQIGREPASAMKIFQTALTFNPRDHDALGNLVQAATKSSRFDLINPALLNTLKKAQPANPDLVALINAQQNSAMTT
jgi:GT2 family glycosyltransferase